MATNVSYHKRSTQSVPVFNDINEESFKCKLYSIREPCVLRDVDIGDAKHLWRDPSYLALKGGSKDIVSHVSNEPKLDFINKNFAYRSMPFDELVAKASQATSTDDNVHKDYYYLRAIGSNPRKDVANISIDFPELSKDIKIPSFFPEDRFFSSVFRIGSPSVQLWTHYDVMDNILIQVVGQKRVVLYPPSEVNKLYLRGDKSEVLDIDYYDDKQFPDFNKAIRWECTLNAGDILFIPALWFHNVTALTYGVAVNVFWKHLDSEMYDSKDVYGNKDPVPVSRATQGIDRAIKLLDALPAEYRQFYGQKLISRINEKLQTRS